jgi:hypothetical protein
LTSLNFLLKLHGLEVFDSQHSSIHGGSVIAYAAHKNKRRKTARCESMLRHEKEHIVENKLHDFAKHTRRKSNKLLSLIQNKGKKKHIYGMGAPAKGNTLLTYCKIDSSLIEKVFEKNQLKVGRYTPVTHIPIVKENTKTVPRGSCFLVLAWNFFDEIMQNNTSLIKNQDIELIHPFEAI